ncbi:oligopeptide transport system ATP-binding protein [Cohaesibacter sp. ES.047]|uniref:ABC transporter ATP-binding protein n=1 Tax=Cohaesibacter sp. ES.047 TaxID=1798205 RepID=UPI000BB6D321|nr:oligopeptide/dipeptide ABC transporter ATP-binding protein [Cohaesibacter sp. ES.047]SNY90714.1 oligopeptide transport system ATP-binding protein [Cohaesibacter sp. ES.047]
MTGEAYLLLENVSKIYHLAQKRFGGTRRQVHAVDNVSLKMARGETLGLVGESGCGKSSLARLILRLERPTDGSIEIDGVDIARLEGRSLKAARQRFQMIFQDPYASLNPRMKVRAIIGEALRNYRVGTRAEIDKKVEAIAKLAGLSSYHLDRYPHELSGGQCQRIGIARAIALEPELIVADEPVSALDVSIQAQILNLIIRLQSEMNLSLIFISHDLSVVSHVADRVAVMYLGRIVEIGDNATLFAKPTHPYTRTLLSAIPRPHPTDRGKKAQVSGELPSPLAPPPGCHFKPRCPFAQDQCSQSVPPLREIGTDHAVACHRAEEIIHQFSTIQPIAEQSQ